jgi:hypothetical protein
MNQDLGVKKEAIRTRFSANYFLLATAPTLLSNPLYTIKELFIDKMSLSQSLMARFTYMLANYIILGYIYVKGRKFFGGKLGIDAMTRGWKKMLFDFFYTGLFSFPAYLFIYGLATCLNFVTGTAPLDFSIHKVLTAMIVGAFLGAVNGYFIDLYKFVFGFEEAQRRIPKFIFYGSLRLKRIVGWLMIVGSIVGTVIIYVLNEVLF